MARKRYSPEQIIGYLREAEVLLSKDSTVPEVCRKIRYCGADLLSLAQEVR